MTGTRRRLYSRSWGRRCEARRAGKCRRNILVLIAGSSRVSRSLTALYEPSRFPVLLLPTLLTSAIDAIAAVVGKPSRQAGPSC